MQAQESIIQALALQHQSAWLTGRGALIETVLASNSTLLTSEAVAHDLILSLIAAEVAARRTVGAVPRIDEYAARFPALAGRMGELFRTPRSSDTAELADARQRTMSAPARATPPGAPEAGSGAIAGPNAGSSSGSAVSMGFSSKGLEGKTFGRFQIRKLLGKGAFGAVYRAYDPNLDLEIALKIPRPGVVDDDEQADRFLREARAAARLHHPYIVRVFDAARVDDLCYISVQLVEGETLDAIVKRRGKFPLPEAVQLIVKLARALDYAHNQKIVHRDLKPGNVMIQSTGDPVVMDFGLARRESAQSQRTQVGVRMGTPSYMSPEQAGGKSHLADARTDQWSLGVMLYELTTGKVPFRASGLSVFVDICKSPAPSPRSIDPSYPEALQAIVARTLEKKPEKRFTSCGEFADALEAWLLHGEPAPPPPVAAGMQPLVAPPAQKPTPAPAKPPQPPTQPAPVQTPVKTTGTPWTARVVTIATALVAQTKTWATQGDWRRPVLVASGFAAALLLLLGITILIRNKDGTTTKIEVPSGVDVKIETPPGATVEVTSTDDTPTGEKQPTDNPPTPTLSNAELNERELEAAREALRSGLMIEVFVDGGRRELRPTDPLPDGASTFRVASFGAKRPASLKFLRDAINLEVLDLSDEPLKLDDVDVIAALPRLKDLRLRGVGFDDALLDRLLPAKDRLEALLVWSPMLSEKGGPKLGEFRKLTWLETGHFRVPADGHQYLTQLKDLKNARFAHNREEWFDERSLAQLVQLKRIEELALNHMELSPESLEQLTQLPALQSLSMHANPRYARASSVSLARISGLTSLVLRHNDLGDEDVALLAKLANLETLSLEVTKVTDAAIPDLLRLKKLRELFVAETDITAEGVERLKKGLPNCAIHWSSRNAPWTPPGRPSEPPPIPPTEDEIKANRRVAELAQKMGLGQEIALLEGGYQFAVRPGDKLPDKPFRLHLIGVCDFKGDPTPLLKELRGRSLVGLWIKDTKLTPEALAMVKEVRGLVHLNLANNSLSADQLATVYELTHLSNLEIEGAGVSDVVLSRLAPLRNLRFLNLRGSKVTDEGLYHLERFKELGEVLLSETAISDAGLAHLGGIPSLSRINLDHTKVTDAGLARLEGLGKLEVLNLSHTAVNGRGFSNLAKLPLLRDLYLREAKVEDKWMPALSKAPSLQTLELHGNPITDAAIPDLLRLTKLTYLDVDETNITAEGAERLRKGLPQCNVMWQARTASAPSPVPAPPEIKTELDAAREAMRLGASVEVEIDGAFRELQPGDTLPASASVFRRVFWPRNCPASVKFLQAAPNLETFDLRSDFLTQQIADEIAAMPKLKRLGLLNSGLDDAMLERLAPLKDRLEKLLAWNLRLTAPGQKKLGEFRKLKSLNATPWRVPAGEYGFFAQMPELEELVLGASRIDHVDGRTLEQLAPLKKLQQLDLFMTELPPDALETLSRLPALKQVLIYGSPTYTYESTANLVKIAGLTKLAIQGNDVTDADVALLAKVKQLEALEIGATKITDGAIPDFLRMGALRYLEIKQTDITAEGYERLKKGLPNCAVVWEARTKPWSRPERPFAPAPLAAAPVVPAPAADIKTEVDAMRETQRLGGTVELNISGGYRPLQPGEEPPAGSTFRRAIWPGARPTSLTFLKASPNLQGVQFGGYGWRPGSPAPPVVAREIDELLELPNLRDLTFYYVPFDDTLLDRLTPLAGRLKSLVVHESKLSDKVGPTLAQFQKLETLHVSPWRIPADQYDFLNQMPELSSISFAKSPRAQFDERTLELVVGLPKVHTLILADTELPPKAFEKLARMPALRGLFLNACANFSREATAHVAKLSNLQTLSLSNNDVTDEDIAKLTALENLATLQIYQTKVTDAAIPDLLRFKNLTYIDARETDITAEGAARLKEGLPQCHQLWQARTQP